MLCLEAFIGFSKKEFVFSMFACSCCIVPFFGLSRGAFFGVLELLCYRFFFFFRDPRRDTHGDTRRDIYLDTHIYTHVVTRRDSR